MAGLAVQCAVRFGALWCSGVRYAVAHFPDSYSKILDWFAVDLDQLSQALGRNLKHWRAERGLTLDALAERAGVSRGMIIQIEQARTNPSVGTTVKLADALGVGIATLLDFERGPQVRIVSGEQTVRMWSTPAGSDASLLVGSDTEGPRELWSWTLMPGDESASDAHPRPPPNSCTSRPANSPSSSKEQRTTCRPAARRPSRRTWRTATATTARNRWRW